jgi:hypothetical protein
VDFPAIARPPGSPPPGAARVVRLPASPARTVPRQAWRIVLWTLAWTLYQWWAVIGWPDGMGSVYAAGVLGAGLGLAGWDVSREVRPRARRAAAVVPLPARPARAGIVGPRGLTGPGPTAGPGDGQAADGRAGGRSRATIQGMVIRA